MSVSESLSESESEVESESESDEDESEDKEGSKVEELDWVFRVLRDGGAACILLWPL